MSEAVSSPISDRELERRWAALRRGMADLGIDVLIAQANNDFMGGYVKYLTDVPAMNGYAVTVLFPRDEAMTLVVHGPLGGDRALPPAGDGLRRGVKRVLTTSSWSNVHFSALYDAELTDKALQPFSGATVGFVGNSFPHSFVGYLRQHSLAKSWIVDASDMVDRVVALKSDEEMELIRRTAAIQDEAMRSAFDAVAPGRRERDIVAAAEAVARAHGSEQGIFLTGSGPLGKPTPMNNRHTQNRVLRQGDQFTMLIEFSGPGGLYTEIGRTCVLGKASQEMKDEFEFVMAARRFTLDRLRPGAACSDIWASYNAFLREHGKPEENRVHCHGQGYDMVERPIVRYDETMSIAPRMNLSMHPTYSTPTTYNWICDNFHVGESGAPRRLHAFPETLVELT